MLHFAAAKPVNGTDKDSAMQDLLVHAAHLGELIIPDTHTSMCLMVSKTMLQAMRFVRCKVPIALYGAGYRDTLQTYVDKYFPCARGFVLSVFCLDCDAACLVEKQICILSDQHACKIEHLSLCATHGALRLSPVLHDMLARVTLPNSLTTLHLDGTPYDASLFSRGISLCSVREFSWSHGALDDNDVMLVLGNLFHGSASLEKLLLDNNDLESPNLGFFGLHLPALRCLDLSHNPIFWTSVVAFAVECARTRALPCLAELDLSHSSKMFRASKSGRLTAAYLAHLREYMRNYVLGKLCTVERLWLVGYSPMIRVCFGIFDRVCCV